MAKDKVGGGDDLKGYIYRYIVGSELIDATGEDGIIDEGNMIPLQHQTVHQCN